MCDALHSVVHEALPAFGVILTNLITSWLMETGSSMANSQQLSINSYPETNQSLLLAPISLRTILVLSSHLRLGLPKGLFLVRLLVRILKAFLPSTTLWAHYLPI